MAGFVSDVPGWLELLRTHGTSPAWAGPPTGENTDRALSGHGAFTTLLYYTLLHYTLLNYTMLCYTTVCYATLCYTTQHYSRGHRAFTVHHGGKKRWRDEIYRGGLTLTLTYGPGHSRFLPNRSVMDNSKPFFFYL